MRVLAIDLGDRRSGVALGDSESGIVTPIEVVESRNEQQRIEGLERVVRDQAPDALIVGLPIHMDGTEGERAKISRAFGEELGRRVGLTVHYQDERLTSYAADQLMSQSGRTRGQKKRIRDALAAAEILRDWLERD